MGIVILELDSDYQVEKTVPNKFEVLIGMSADEAVDKIPGVVNCLLCPKIQDFNEGYEFNEADGFKFKEDQWIVTKWVILVTVST